jgi:hypothetical protein
MSALPSKADMGWMESLLTELQTNHAAQDGIREYGTTLPSQNYGAVGRAQSGTQWCGNSGKSCIQIPRAAFQMQCRLCSFGAWPTMTTRPLRNDQNTADHDRRDHQRGEGTAQGKSTMVQGLVEEITQSGTKRSG